MGWGRRPEGTEVSGACCRLSVCGWHDAGHWRHAEGEKQEASPRLRARGHAAASSGEEADGGTLERRLSLKWKCSPEPACPQRRHSRSLFPRSPGPSPAHIDAGILAGACPKGRGRACSVWGQQGELDGRRFGGRGTGGAHGRAAAAGCPGAHTGPRAAQAQEGPEASPRTAQDGWGCSHATASEHGFQEGRGAWSVHTGSFLMEQRRVSSSAQGNSSLSTMPRALRDKCCTVPRP